MAFCETFWIYLSWIFFVFATFLLFQSQALAVSIFYPYLRKPAWTTPSWLAMIIWIIVLALIGFWAGFFYDLEGGWGGAPWQLGIFAAHVIVLGLWYIIFARYQMLLFSFIWSILVLVLAVLSYVAFLITNAHILIILLPIPHLVWLVYLVFLHYQIWRCNCNWVRIFCVAARCKSGKAQALPPPTVSTSAPYAAPYAAQHSMSHIGSVYPVSPGPNYASTSTTTPMIHQQARFGEELLSNTQI